jgi:hypothetical protein
MTTYTFDENIVSDLHKDARGYRPTQSWWQMWGALGDKQKQNVWDGLGEELEDTMDRERRAQADAMIALHQRIQGTMLLGAKDEVQALVWIMQAEKFTEYDIMYGPSYFCYHFGLAYSAEKEFPIKEAMAEIL